MFRNAALSQNENTNSESFTCTPYILVVILIVLEMLRSFYEDSLVKCLQALVVPHWVHKLLPFAMSFIFIFLLAILFDRQNEVILEENYIQVGNSPFHFFRTDEIKEISFKGSFLVIRTKYFWRTGRYRVNKKQRDNAHQLLSTWADRHDVNYIRIF